MAVPPPGASDALIPAGAAARFAADLARAAGRAIGGGERLALAVSGGPDSMAMLALACAALPGRVVAATFDHGLRAEAADEAAMVARWCGGRGVDHATLHPAAPLPRRNVQAAARSARYTALADWAADRGAMLLATAHHADDQAETFLMRAGRGSGPTGLAGIRRRRALDAVTLVRPLLAWRRAELAAVAAALPSVADPSNRDDRFARVRVRRWLAMPDAVDAGGFAGAAAHVAEMAADLDALADWAWGMRAEPGPVVTLDVAGLPRALRRMLVRRAVIAVRARHDIALPPFGTASNVEPLLDALEDGRRATQGGVLADPADSRWRFGPAPPRRHR